VTRALYRLPWRIATSPTLAVRVADGCGLGCCDGVSKFLPLAIVATALEQGRQWPSADSIALVGGEPTRHPQIFEIVRLARQVRSKVIVCSNGYELGAERVSELRDAGVWGVNFRVNRTQSRPGWRDCSEAQIEGLRSHFAELVASVGGLLCSFEVEISMGDFRLLAETLAWAERHVDRVQRLVLHFTSPRDNRTESGRPTHMADNWSPAGWLSAPNDELAATVAWRVGRRGSDVLAASPRLLRMVSEYYNFVHGRSFSYLNPLSLHSQLTCWIAAFSDMSLRPLTKEILISLRNPSGIISPRLASQFLFCVEQEDKRGKPKCEGAAYDSLSVPINDSV
jgi:hypothetical protein